MATAQPGSGPTVRRIMLGAQLRRLREAAGLTREEAGYTIRASDLLTICGVTDEAERAPLLDLAREANIPGWWHPYSDVLPSWFQAYVGLEEAAAY